MAVRLKFCGFDTIAGVSLKPWRFNAPMYLNCEYFNLNFCTENLELNVFSLKFESWVRAEFLG